MSSGVDPEKMAEYSAGFSDADNKWKEALTEHANIPESVPLEPLAVAHYIMRLQHESKRRSTSGIPSPSDYPLDS